MWMLKVLYHIALEHALGKTQVAIGSPEELPFQKLVIALGLRICPSEEQNRGQDEFEMSEILRNTSRHS